MGVTCLNGKELDPDEKAPKNSEKNIEEFKPESDRDITILELEMEFEKMIKKFPLNLDAIRGESTSRYWLESSPHGSDLDLASFSSLLNSIKNLGWRSADSGEYENSFSLNLLNKTLSLFNFPLNLSLSELILLRRTRSLNDTGSFISERSVIDSIANVVLSHSAWWKLDAFQENTKALSNTSSKKSKSESSSPDEEASEVKFPKMKIISPPSSKSSFSWQSTSSANSSITKGQLQCFQNGGMLYFIFSLDDAPQVIYIASPQKIKSSAEKAIDGMYLFYSKGSNNGDSRNLIAKMKVSSSIVLTPNRLKIMETEFVLYDYRDELSNKPRNSSSVVSRSKGFPRKFAEMFRQSNMVKINDQKFDGLGEDAVDVLLPNLELAAIVVQDCFHDAANGGLMFGGWGLKFLEKAGQKDASLEPSLHSCSSKNRSDRDKSARRMNVLIPADRHGGPVSRHGGAASIVARWRSGGRCDCGGWDIGCPLTVLNHSSVYSSASTKDSEKKTVNLLMEGTKNGGHPTLSIMKMSEGLYSICFQSSLSVLQSFSIAVAAVHKNC